MSRGNIRRHGAARVRSLGVRPSCSFPTRLAVAAIGVLPPNLEARVLGDVWETLRHSVQRLRMPATVFLAPAKRPSHSDASAAQAR